MNSKQLTVLVALLAASGGAAYFMKGKRNNAADRNGEIVGTPLVKGFSIDELGAFSVTDSKNTVTIERKDGKWIVPARENFPANAKAVFDLTDNVTMMTISSATAVDESDYGRIQVKEPAQGLDEKEAGKAVSLKSTSGSEIATFVLGKTGGKKDDAGGMMGMTMDMGGGPKPQWVRLKGAQEVYEVKAGLVTINGDPKTWLDKENFLKIEKLKSVSVTGADPAETYKVFRETEGGELKLDAPQAGEDFDGPGKAAGVGTFMSYGQFEDIATAADKDKTGLDKPARTAVVETFDGFTFTVKVGNKVAPAPGAAPATPDGGGAPESFYMSFTADGKFQETRTAPPADKDGKPAETDEQKKAAEEAFAKNLQEQKDKLAKFQALKDRVFVVSKYNLEAVMRKRGELMKEKAADTAATPPAGGPGAGIVPQIAPAATSQPIEVKTVGKGSATKTADGKIEAVTPPISVEIPAAKDAKPADAKPADK